MERTITGGGTKITVTVKTAVCILLIALSAALPQFVHIVAGAEGGMRWLPMYFPALIGACLFGPRWGLLTGLCSPLFSFFVTSLAGNSMPAAARLPYMTCELVFSAVTAGAFYRKIGKNALFAFPAVLIAGAGGRALFLALAAIFESVSPITLSAAWAQVRMSVAGLAAQAVLAPIVVMGASALIKRELR